MRSVIFLLAFLVFPPAAFYGGYTMTERVFRSALVPYPFEQYGFAVGLGLFFWTLAVLVWVLGKRNKGGTSR